MNKSVSKNIIFKFLLNVFNLVVPILIGPYTLRVLGPELMGSINFSQAIFGYFFIFAGFGVYQYGLREISKVRDNKEKLTSTFTSLFVLTLITNVVTTITYVIFVTNNYSGTDTYVACMILTFNLLANIFYTEWVNEALENFDFITIKTIIVRIIYVILLFVMVKSAANFKQYMYLLVLSTFLNNIISFIYIKKKINFNFKNISILKHVKPMFLVVILSNANVLFTQLDRFMLGERVNVTSVGYYTTAQNISNIINSLMLTVIFVSIPRLSNYSANRDEENYISLLEKTSKIYLLFLFPASIGMYLLSNEIILLYGGHEFIASTPMLRVFSIYIITLGIEAILGNQIMYIKHREKQQVQLIFLAGLINLVLNVYLVITDKFTGTTAIFTTMIANTALITFQYIYVRTKLKIKFNVLAMDKIKYLFISLIFIPITFVIKKYMNGIVDSKGLEALLISAVAIAVNSVAYFSVLFLLKDKIMLEILDKVLQKIKSVIGKLAK